MAEEKQASGDPGIPEIKDKAPKAPGILPKNTQTWVMIAIAVVMILVIGFSGGNPPKPKATTAAERAAAVVQPSPQRIQDYQHQVADQTRKIQEEQAQLERAKQDLAAAKNAAMPGSAPYGSPGYPQQSGYPPGGYSGQTQQPAEKSAIQSDKEKRDYTSLFASNLSLSYRKDASGSQPQQRAPSVNQQLENNIRELQQLAAAQQGQGIPPYPYPGNAMPPQAAAQQAAPFGGAASAAADQKDEAPQSEKLTGLRGTGKQTKDRPELRQAEGKSHRIFEGTVMETVLTNRLNGDFSGPVNCMVTTNVYSHDHQRILIPQGTRILGEAQKVSNWGQQRLAVFFHRLIMPDGFSVNLDQFQGLNQVGETGLKDKVNRHYAQIFGASLAIGAVAGVAQAGTRYGGGYGGDISSTDAYRQGMAQSLSQSSMRVLDKFLNVMPTFTIREGHRVKVYLSDDLLIPSYDHHTLNADL